MKIKWTSVTWYSKTIALILFVLLPFIGFYAGIWYQKETTSAEKPATKIIYDQDIHDILNNRYNVATSSARSLKKSDWIAYTDHILKFSISYPETWTVKTSPAHYAGEDKDSFIYKDGGVVLMSGSDSLSLEVNFEGGLCEATEENQKCQESKIITDLGIEGKKLTRSGVSYYIFSFDSKTMWNILVVTESQNRIIDDMIKTLEVLK